MSTPIQPVPDVILASEFPSLSDRPAGTYNAKAKAWADSENAMATRTREIALVGHNNTVVATEQAVIATNKASEANDAKLGAEAARDTALLHKQGAKDAEDSAWAAAAALGADPDLFPQPLVPGKVLGAISPTAVGWVDALRPGDVITTIHPPSTGWLKTGEYYLQSAYADLFSAIGLVPDKPTGDSWQFASGAAMSAANGLAAITESILVAVGGSNACWRSIDAGASWAAVSGLTGIFNAVARITDSIVVAVGNSGAVFRSTDAGATWASVPGLTGSLTAVARVTDSIVVAVAADGGIWRSANAGASWTSVATLESTSLQSVASLNSSIVLAGAASGQSVRSVDGGLTWAVATNLGSSIYAIARISDSVALACGSAGKCVRTEDAGLTWYQAIGPFGPSSLLATVSPLTSEVIFVASNAKTFRSTDGGRSFAEVSQPAPVKQLASVGGDLVVGIPSGSGPAFRSVDAYDYDTGSMFYVPRADAPFGFNALMKA